jgi:hypothetical protein
MSTFPEKTNASNEEKTEKSSIGEMRIDEVLGQGKTIKEIESDVVEEKSQTVKEDCSIMETETLDPNLCEDCK